MPYPANKLRCPHCGNDHWTQDVAPKNEGQANAEDHVEILCECCFYVFTVRRWKSMTQWFVATHGAKYRQRYSEEERQTLRRSDDETKRKALEGQISKSM